MQSRVSLYSSSTLLNRQQSAASSFDNTKNDDGHRARSRRTFSSSSVQQSNKNDYFDVVIVGGGAVGCSMARLLHERIPSLSVALLEAQDKGGGGGPADDDNNNNTDRIPHPRSYALSPHSLQVLGRKVVDQLNMGRYDAMQVWQANSPASVTFTIDDLYNDNHDGKKQPTLLGACVEDGPLVDTLWKELVQSPNVTCQTGTKLERIATTGSSHQLAQVETNQDGQIIDTSLLIAADGGNSWIRKALSIDKSGFAYDDQQALTFTVELASDMPRRAFQRFLPDGSPMALLPTFSPTHAVVVWSTHPDVVRYWKDETNSSLLVDHLNQSFLEGPQRIPPLFEGQAAPSSSLSNLFYGAEKVLETVHYGMAMASHHPQPKFVAPPTITGVVSPPFSFPLSCYQADDYVQNRVALIGDAAHTVHPMAGQGLNLGLSDVDFLVKTIQKAHGSGMDLSTFLSSDYESNRKRNVTLSLGGIHALQQIFGNDDRLLQHAKTFGMNVIQNLSPLRRQLAVAATQGVQF